MGKGLTYGVLLFLIMGSVILDSDNRDFGLFGPRVLSVTLFGLLFPLYGALQSSIAERLNRHVPALLDHPIPTVAGYVALAGLSSFGLFHTVRAINAIL